MGFLRSANAKGSGKYAMTDQPIAVVGATGYVGGRLVPRLLNAGYRVRAVARSVEKIGCRSWAGHPRVSAAAADVLDPAALAAALDGCRAAYYLVHSMVARKKGFADADRKGAFSMAAAAAAVHLERVIYLGGLGDVGHSRISLHLLSRHETGRILQAGPVPVTVLRAAMILGAGSASFEMLRYLVERLPLMIAPRWVMTPTQPIAIGNVLDYLVGCLACPETTGGSFDIGGPRVLRYVDLIHLFTREACLRRRVVLAVPFLSPGLSARWIHLVTPVPAAIAKPLAEGLATPTVCEETRIRSLLPIALIDCRQAIRLALQRVAQARVDTCWSDAGALQPPEWLSCGDADYSGGTVLACGYRARVHLPVAAVWELVARIGGTTGWYFADVLWRLRGMVDRLLGGVGLHRGRRDPADLRVGDALDFWRVLAVTPPGRLLLLAEMKLPGQALLDIRVTSAGAGQTEIQLLSRFLPAGLWGILYWYALYPFHQMIFRGMLRALARTAGGTVAGRPRRFTPKLPAACRLPRR